MILSIIDSLKMRAFLLFLCFFVAAHCQNCSRLDADVLILGGGMAGVSAANRLNELGVADFILLEAQDRLGGRMRTEEIVPGVNLSVGANWIHGVDRTQPRLHPLFDLAERCGGLQGVYTNTDNIITYDSDGNEVMDSSLRYTAYESAFAAALERNGGDVNNDFSARDGLTQAGWTPSSARDNFVEWYNFDFSFAETPNVTSVAGIYRLPDRDFIARNGQPGEYFITDRRGYPYLVQCLANNFTRNSADDRIHLNATVTRIQYGDECVCVTATENGEETQYCASYAIVTFSVEVLRQQGPTLFSPQLSEAKRNALNFIRMGFYYIIITEYERKFWDDIQFIGHIDSPRGYFPVIIPVHESFGVNATAVHVTGELAFRLAGMSDNDVIAEIAQVLRNIYGSNVPAARNIIRMSWGTNPLFLGSYSNVRPDGADMVRQLRVPEGRVYFAGEATSERYRGNTHGAYLSGIDTVNALVNGVSAAAKFMGNTALIMIVMIAALITV